MAVSCAGQMIPLLIVFVLNVVMV